MLFYFNFFFFSQKYLFYFAFLVNQKYGLSGSGSKERPILCSRRLHTKETGTVSQKAGFPAASQGGGSDEISWVLKGRVSLESVKQGHTRIIYQICQVTIPVIYHPNPDTYQSERRSYLKILLGQACKNLVPGNYMKEMSMQV